MPTTASDRRRIIIRCTPEQRARILANAARSGFGVSTYIRLSALNPGKMGILLRSSRTDTEQAQLPQVVDTAQLNASDCHT
jgi:hypothetical protein